MQQDAEASLSSDAPVVISLRGIEAGYGRIRALHGIDLEVRAGQIVTLLGANGAGKTTTLKTISGLVRATAGSIKFDGQELIGRKASDIARMGVVHVPEGRHVLRGLSVRENLELGGLLSADAALRRDGWSTPSRFFRSSRRGSTRTARFCPAASSRCWPSAGP